MFFFWFWKNQTTMHVGNCYEISDMDRAKYSTSILCLSIQNEKRFEFEKKTIAILSHPLYMKGL